MNAKQLIDSLPTIDGDKPHAYMVVDGSHLVTGRVDETIMICDEHGDGLIDYYGDYRGGYPYVHPVLEQWAEDAGGYWEWEHPGAITFIR